MSNSGNQFFEMYMTYNFYAKIEIIIITNTLKQCLRCNYLKYMAQKNSAMGVEILDVEPII
ncbi:MAG: hypothetical protein CVU05_04090 [Bacteroidetes bacterium HGW-Bacteroidetes-21]|jgi:hypothetical protein|nr:MAG: hypothetical protein CVU05_04090 [Bacteroidetes bacterium HGW-Bacteroidetes-21]